MIFLFCFVLFCFVVSFFFFMRVYPTSPNVLDHLSFAHLLAHLLIAVLYGEFCVGWTLSGSPVALHVRGVSLKESLGTNI